MATIFVSPGVYTREQDFSVFASRVGLTKLGLVGLTQKGPAFEPVSVRSTDEFLFRFGATSSELQLPYVANSFLTQSNELTVTRVLGKEGYTDSNAWLITADGPTTVIPPTSGVTATTYSTEKTIIAVIKSKSADEGLTFLNTSATDIEKGTSASLLGSFVLSGASGDFSANTLTVSLDESRDDYIVNVIGRNPKKIEGDYGIYVDTIFPHYLRQAAAEGTPLTGISDSITFSNDARYTDFVGPYTNPSSPYVVSNLVGGQVRKLFKCQSVSDGNSANREIKISITNIDTITKTFDVLVRDFNDTDSSAFQTALERFRGVTMDPTQRNYIARVIGTTDEEYPRQSLFITLDMQEGHPGNVVPGGFEGYSQVSAGSTGTTAAPFFYKKSYFSGDSVSRTFLGISELAYTAFTADKVSFSNVINTIEADKFKYIGTGSVGKENVPGFHIESGAPSGFVSGDLPLSGYTKAERKFTFAPAGGFDGWNKFKTPTFGVNVADASNRNAFKEAVDTFTNPEEVDVNLFATPGINYGENEEIVKYSLNIMEERADTLYIIDSPRLTTSVAKGTPEEAVLAMQDTGIDSNYAATYWPWVQIEDQTTGQFVYLPPTAEVVKSIALTDNVAFPWFAPAGINRGTVGDSVRRADIKLSQNDRDTLYEGRINPIATFVQNGVVIYGQKTLQIRQSALDRINVRRLLLQIRRVVAATSQTLLFEQNDQTLRDQFLSKVEPLLLQIQNQRGLTGFRVIMDESNNPPEVVDRNTLVGKIQLKPTRTAEFIDLTFQVLPTGARFEDF
tara:strand:+ start:2595 stop:4967 length:2373 start_codon:yes stop_codon:yes gene_type:complete